MVWQGPCLPSSGLQAAPAWSWVVCLPVTQTGSMGALWWSLESSLQGGRVRGEAGLSGLCMAVKQR